jgi:hypothetical protein
MPMHRHLDALRRGEEQENRARRMGIEEDMPKGLREAAAATRREIQKAFGADPKKQSEKP